MSDFSFLLQTHERDLNSLLAMKIRREMLLALANKTCYSNDKEKQEKVLQKYKAFTIPVSMFVELYGINY